MRWWCSLFLAAVLAAPAAAVLKYGCDGAPASSQVCAEEPAAEGEAAPQSFTWGDALAAGGVVGGIIILLSVAALALIIQYSIEQKHDRMVPPHVVTELEQLFEDQAYDEAADLCQSENCYLTRVVGAGLAQMEGGYDAIVKAVEQMGDEETTKYFSKLSNLSLLVGVAPMLGLYGTVTGMISAFNVIASTAGGASPAQLAYGISQALVTTFEGLTVAIPTSVAFHFLKARLLVEIIEVQTISTNLFERFRRQQQA